MLKVYLCAFLNNVYIEEAKICIESLRKTGRFTGPIYLFTDKDISINGVEIIKVKCESIPLSASFRTRLFEHVKDFNSDDIFLYLDTDIVLLKPLPSYDLIGDKINVYGYPLRTQAETSFSGFLTNDSNYTSKTAICSGILLFRPSPKVKKVFDDTYKLYTELILKKKINGCWEQPALCLILIKEDMYDISLTDFVYEERTKTKIQSSHIFNHFCSLRSNKRYEQMKNIFKKLTL
jgi:hypothetical protein